MHALRFFGLWACFMLWASVSFAQQQVYVVYLHNGWELKGKIAYEDASLTVRTKQDNLFVFDTTEVERVEPHFVGRKWGKALSPRPTRGYTGLISVSNLSGTQASGWGESFPVHSFDLQFVNSYRFSHWLTVGVGTGISLYDRGPLMPIYADVRTDLLARRMTPHAYVRGGYSLPLYQNEDWVDQWGNEREGSATGGIILEAGVGMKLFTLGQAAWMVSLGVRQQATQDVFGDWGGNLIEESQVFQRVVIGISVGY